MTEVFFIKSVIIYTIILISGKMAEAVLTKLASKKGSLYKLKKSIQKCISIQIRLIITLGLIILLGFGINKMMDLFIVWSIGSGLFIGVLLFFCNENTGIQKDYEEKSKDTKLRRKSIIANASYPIYCALMALIVYILRHYGIL